jgi:hypothetical protein
MDAKLEICTNSTLLMIDSGLLEPSSHLTLPFGYFYRPMLT